jgi:hypothetical protein
MSMAQADEIRTLIQEQIRASTPAQRVYNPSPEFVEQKVNGLIYTLPPKGYGKRSWEKVGREYDGILVVQDQWGISNEARKKAKARGTNPRDIRPDKIIATALVVVSHLVAKLSKRGVCFLSGDPATDAERMAEADATWTEFEYETAQTIVNNYNNRTAAFHRIPQNAGKLPPSMTDREIQAQEVIDARHEGHGTRFEFVCKHRDGYGTNDHEKMDRHYRVAHTAAVEPPSAPEPSGGPVAPKRRGRPPKVQAEAQ